MASLLAGAAKAKTFISLFLDPIFAAPIFLLLSLGICGLRAALWGLLGLGLVRILNKQQNVRACNNWKLPAHGGWHWTEEIAVVTGGCNGIGKATVLGLVQKGVRVAVLDVADLPPDLEQLGAVWYWKCDITSLDAVNKAADEIRERLGHPSILINNAGLTNISSILDSAPDRVSKLLSVNVLSHWHTVKAFLPAMVLKNKGHIVTMASVGSYIALPTFVAYSASKAAILGFHEGLTCEIKHIYKAPGVMTTVVNPGFVNTDMTKSEKGRIERSTGKMLEPQYISDTVVEQLLSCRGGQLFLPSRLWWLSAVRGLPNWMQEMIRDGVAKV